MSYWETIRCAVKLGADQFRRFHAQQAIEYGTCQETPGNNRNISDSEIRHASGRWNEPQEGWTNAS